MRSGDCLHDVFAARARDGPDRTAVRTPGGEDVSYGELDLRAERVAGRLRSRGVGPGSLVGLCCDRDAHLIAGMLGILKAGGAYLPIDPGYPDERIRLLLADSGARLAVVAGSGSERVRRCGIDMATIDMADAEDAAGADHAPPRAGLEDMAYVIYTSGSTGRPKGVEVTHRNVLRLFTSTAHWFGFGHHDVWTLFHSASFDFSVWEIWGSLLHGGTLVIVPVEAARAPVELLRLLRKERVTVLNQTPSAFRLLLAADSLGGPVDDLALRLVIFGGERLDVGLLEPWIERHGDERPLLVNMYGITETTVHVTYRVIRASDLRRPELSPVGVPIPDLRVTLHDEQGERVPDGTPGEIRVSGPGLARGYRGRPDLTDERFVTGPDGRRAYCSGDRGAWDESGDLVHLGRIDDQLKVRGFRIEPYEVEACLTTHPSVDCAVVTAEDCGDGDVRLVAYLQAASDQPTFDAATRQLRDDLMRHAAALLPAHLRPWDHRLVDRIPLTPQGKADRAAFLRPGNGAT